MDMMREIHFFKNVIEHKGTVVSYTHLARNAGIESILMPGGKLLKEVV